MDIESGSVIPINLVEGRFLYFTADNIDISEGTLDGQNTSHATQYAAWQRGPESIGVLQNISPSKYTTLKVPDELNMTIPAQIREGTAEPQFEEHVQEKWFKKENESTVALVAEAKDAAFFLERQNEYLK